jgi:hypothetical protein
MEFEDLPEIATVEEAAACLRIGRSLAYDEAARFRATRGRTGLPCVRIGKTIRIPRAELLAWLKRQIEDGGADAA